jgi:hypothetical protein
VPYIKTRHCHSSFSGYSHTCHPPPLQEVTGLPQPGFSGLQDPIPLSLRKSIAVYEAGKALIAYITPEYDEIARVSICPYNMVTGT